MNTVVLLGRLTKDIELRYTQKDNKAVASFNIAVQRDYKDAEGNYTADFVPCVAYGTTAENLGKYFSKGQRIAVTGKLNTGSYTDKEGKKVYTWNVIVNSFDFIESRNQGNNSSSSSEENNNGFIEVSEAIESELPFN